MKKSILILCINLSFLSVFSQSVTKSMKRLPDTGQNTSYTATFGEDNDYTINTPFFINNGDGTVTDTVTGLIWQKTDGGEMTFENALIYCDSLTLGGKNDWRLPNAYESFSILNHQNNGPALNTSIFTKTNAEYWWTSDKQNNDANKIWVTNAGGGIGNHLKTETLSAGGTKKFHTRAVRDATVPKLVQNRLTNNGNATITDNLTGLIWEQILISNSMTWEQALTYAENLSLAGQNDWRLPNIKELQSLCDLKITSPCIDNSFFTGININKYWSSTSLPNQTSKAWYLSTQFGITTYDDKTNTNYIICVRGGISGSNSFTSEKKLSSFHIYPNPVKKDLFIINNDSRPFTFEIFDQMGQTVYLSEPVINSEQFQVNTESLHSGLYYLRLKHGTDCITLKFNVQ